MEDVQSCDHWASLPWGTVLCHYCKYRDDGQQRYQQQKNELKKRLDPFCKEHTKAAKSTTKNLTGGELDIILVPHFTVSFWAQCMLIIFVYYGSTVAVY